MYNVVFSALGRLKQIPYIHELYEKMKKAALNEHALLTSLAKKILSGDSLLTEAEAFSASTQSLSFISVQGRGDFHLGTGPRIDDGLEKSMDCDKSFPIDDTLEKSMDYDKSFPMLQPPCVREHAQQEMHEMISVVAYDPLENLTNDPTNVTDPVQRWVSDPTPQTANPRKRSLSLAVEEGGGDDSKEIDWKLELNKTQKNELKDMDNGHVAAIIIKHNLLLEITAKDVPTDPSKMTNTKEIAP
nr:pentatricopeptide repeat-containing protein At1g51965, mitochondrial [Ipomoea batatas]